MYCILLPKKKKEVYVVYVILLTLSHVGDSMKNENEFWTPCDLTILPNLSLNPSTFTTYPEY